MRSTQQLVHETQAAEKAAEGEAVDRGPARGIQHYRGLPQKSNPLIGR